MEVFQTGTVLLPGPGSVQIAQDKMTTGDYVMHYGSPRVVYTLLSPSTVASAIEGWCKLQNITDFTEQIQINGVQIDPESGEIFLNVHLEVSDVNKSEFNPLVILAIVAGLFTVLGIGITLLGVYTVEGVTHLPLNPGATTGGGVPHVDPCTESGILATLQCWTGRSAWIGIGLLIGAVLVAVLAIGYMARNNA